MKLDFYIGPVLTTDKLIDYAVWEEPHLKPFKVSTWTVVLWKVQLMVSFWKKPRKGEIIQGSV
tara:strand:- start:6041 stop:6229 length:189 start_codon:yes stop_codon:yes gene_type:complete